MRHGAAGRRAAALFGEVLHGRHAVHPVRRGSGLPLSLGGDSPATEDVRVLGDAGVRGHRAGGFLLHLEKRRARLGQRAAGTGRRLMPPAAPVTDLEQLKQYAAVNCLTSWNPAAITAAKLDRGELSLTVDRSALREACALLRDDASCKFNYLSDVTCVDWYPAEPRFEVIYHLLSFSRKERVRL